jgi:hypothetical protein
MTRLRHIVLGGIAALAIGGVAGSATAMESGTFQNRLNGATIGLPLGAAAPPGIYTGLETAYLGVSTGTSGASTGNQCVAVGGGGCAKLPAVAQAVPLLWVPGWNFLGATYSASLVQAFYVFNTCGVAGSGGSCSGGSPVSGGGFVYTNTFFNPIALSWNLGGGLFVSTGFNFTAPTGTKGGVGNLGSNFTPNPSYWTLEPSFAVSYLGSNWALSANFFYDINTASSGGCCVNGAFFPGNAHITSGNALYGDLEALYKFGKWSMGPVGYFEVQTTSDTGGCIPAPGVNLCGKYQTAALGALVGYDFGPVDLQVWFTDQFAGQDTPAGRGSLDVWTRIGFRLWGPEAPHPLVSKN